MVDLLLKTKTRLDYAIVISWFVFLRKCKCLEYLSFYKASMDDKLELYVPGQYFPTAPRTCLKKVLTQACFS